MRNSSPVGKSIIIGATLAAIAALFQPAALAHGGAAGNASSEDPAAVALIHSAPGSAVAGEVRVAEGDDTALLQLRIVDKATDATTHCRVNVIGADGHYYEPEDNPLAPWSLQRLGNRKFKGPFRYYGWFFYSDGEDTIRVPAGEVTVEVWKG
ncbi:MAG: hypothetical protein L3K26_16370, partial [Candidatus Hydrogenedentes bacterium]|nr:hypothetical protein [Candidatus Hydrogenedentota bacterium]